MEMISVCGGSSDLQHTILRKSPAGERVPSGLRPAFEVTLLTTRGTLAEDSGDAGKEPRNRRRSPRVSVMKRCASVYRPPTAGNLTALNAPPDPTTGPPGLQHPLPPTPHGCFPATWAPCSPHQAGAAFQRVYSDSLPGQRGERGTERHHRQPLHTAITKHLITGDSA